ncbi:hypothetical protein KJI95_09995 [Shewanella sp. JM162201]|uniref:Uncharacterized protein n=1 Tax=Shewanella jiangmenensis TaxID=2837387 RepID=A0ABS5V748_9GAMM|nr:hypothetical protein [Shewanella jiangmenensis]MBT1444853.1 hypothetical protein [Shewanella jiangmenensis]
MQATFFCQTHRSQLLKVTLRLLQLRLSLLLVFCAALALMPAAQASDNAGRIAASELGLVGVWGNSDDSGKTFWGFDEYRGDGTFRAWGNQPDGVAYQASGVYQVVFEGGQKKLCLKFIKVSEPLNDIVGEVFCSIIVSVDGKPLCLKMKKPAKSALFIVSSQSFIYRLSFINRLPLINRLPFSNRCLGA